jgi:hypothetical protein
MTIASCPSGGMRLETDEQTGLSPRPNRRQGNAQTRLLGVAAALGLLLLAATLCVDLNGQGGPDTASDPSAANASPLPAHNGVQRIGQPMYPQLGGQP